MKLLAALAALTIAAGVTAAPAFARDSYVVDNASLLSPATVTLLNSKISDFNATTHKEVFVDIEPTLSGTAAEAEEKSFAQHQVNGVLIYVAKSPKTIAVIPDRVSHTLFPSGETGAIRQAIVSAFNSGDFNGGISNGVDLIFAQYRSHLGAVRTHAYAAPVAAPEVQRSETGGGFNMGIIWWLIALAVIFFVVRGIFRAISGPRMMPPGYGGGPMGGPMGGGYGPGYGGGGYGGGGFGGGGGGFWSGMLGGLGGAFLGNELFGNRGGGEGFIGGNQAGFGGDGGQQDNSGFQNDAGQADMGNASSGGWGGGGDSGGGWGGGGDSGGGWGGGDSGGGGGDSGGGGW